MAEKKTLTNLETRLARLEASVAQVLQRPGGTIVDPGPGPGVIADPAPWPQPHPIADPAPWPWYPYQQRPRQYQPRPVGDPVPIDLSRFTRVQLESSLHAIAAERIRLDGMEELINKQLGQMAEGG